MVISSPVEKRLNCNIVSHNTTHRNNRYEDSLRPQLIFLSLTSSWCQQLKLPLDSEPPIYTSAVPQILGLTKQQYPDNGHQEKAEKSPSAFVIFHEDMARVAVTGLLPCVKTI